MYRASTAVFRKLRTCPSAETLIMFRESGLVSEGLEAVARHLSACDFCGAEMQLLARHWSRDYCLPQFAREIPSHLRRLAEDLMAEPSLDRARFVETVCELDKLTLTDAA